MLNVVSKTDPDHRAAIPDKSQAMGLVFVKISTGKNKTQFVLCAETEV
jgi:hypothetical protein